MGYFTPAISRKISRLTVTKIPNRKDKSNEEINTEITKLMIDKKVLTKESARKLVDRNKLHISNKEILE